MKDEEINDLVESANEKLKEDAEGTDHSVHNGMDEGEFDDPHETLRATPLVKTEEGKYTGTIGSKMSIDINISGGHKCGKAGAARHFIDSILERFGDERPIQIDHIIDGNTKFSRKYNQTITQSRAYAPTLKVTITEDN